MEESTQKEIIMSVSLLIIGTILAEVMKMFFANISIRYIYYRNFLFFRITILFFRNNIKENRDKREICDIYIGYNS